MKTRWSRYATGALVVIVALMAGTSWAIFDQLEPSADDYKLKFEVQVTPAAGNKLTVDFTLIDDGRMKPLHSVTVVAFSNPNSSGSRSYLVKEVIALAPTSDGNRAGKVQIPSEFAERASIRFLAKRVDGRPRTGGASAAYYDVPLKKFMK